MADRLWAMLRVLVLLTALLASVGCSYLQMQPKGNGGGGGPPAPAAPRLP